MESKSGSLAAHIEDLARRVRVRPHFVDRVRALFLEKGVSLDADGTPFREVLEEAFRREERIFLARRKSERNLRRASDDARRVRDEIDSRAGNLRRPRGAEGERRGGAVGGVLRLQGGAAPSAQPPFETRSDAQSIEVDPQSFH